MEKEVAVQQAFAKMQAAETTKDIDPDGYRLSRIRYYRLAQGEGWMDEERDRVLKDAQAFTSEWQSQYDTLQSQRNSQRNNVELVRAAKNTQTGLQEDVQFAVDQLKRVISRETDKKNVDERLAQFASQPGGPWAPPGWLNSFLDVLIILLVGFGCLRIYRWISRPAYGVSSPPSFFPGT